LGVGDVVEHLDARGHLVHGNDAVSAVNRETGQQHELRRPPAGAGKRQERVSFRRKDLQTVQYRIGDVHVAVGINRNAFGAREHARAVAALAPDPDEVAVGVVDDYAGTDGVGDIEKTVGINGNAVGIGESASSVRVFVFNFAEVAEKFETVEVEDGNALASHIGNVEAAQRIIDRHAGGAYQVVCSKDAF